MARGSLWVAVSAWLAAAMFYLLSAGRPGHADPAATTAEAAPITPVPRPAGLDPAKVRLGEKLFHDVRLSHDNVVACASCHRLDRGGDDDRVRPMGSDGLPLDYNAPTIFNATLSFRYNWRGNFRELETQNESTLRDRRLMNTSWDELLAKLGADPAYRNAFARAYGGRPERTHVLDALASFQRSLLTPNARFDRYLRGEDDAITDEEKRGYQLFRGYGCIACHQGVNIGGNLFQKFGVFDNPFARRERITTADLGRFTITGDERDRHVLRVPSLRNVALTAPYFHDGSAGSLSEAVDIMALSQLGRTLEVHEIDLIVKFLGSLTGEYRGQ
ncbi:cytochrome-c peroxidase [Reyranella sp.]|uniref:cytochrome-c peroxidase n=1 Tax=Reyranella sp. TaxID=1929291 RepID=UPI003D0A728F